MKPILAAAALAAGIAVSTPALAEDAYARSILSRPLPSNENARIRECNWLRAEIARQWGIADIMLDNGTMNGGIVRAYVRMHVAALETRAANLQCPAAFR